ncbi:hypothetical protein AC1031_004765 [Aphanomyces cochlioides]|nr:hypothetical protein AC1031_004765 [Aphanomyces cochlioides]
MRDNAIGKASGVSIPTHESRLVTALAASGILADVCSYQWRVDLLPALPVETVGCPKKVFKPVMIVPGPPPASANRGRKSAKDSSLVPRINFSKPTLFLARFKQVFCAIDFTLYCMLYMVSTPRDLQAVQAY